MALLLVGLALFATSVATFTLALALLGKGKLDSSAIVWTGAGVLDAFLGVFVIATAALGELSALVTSLLFVLAFTLWGGGIIIGKGLDLKALGNAVLILGIILVVLTPKFFPVNTFLGVLLVVLFITYFLLTGFTYGIVPGTVVAALLVIATIVLLYGGATIFVTEALP